MKRVQAISLMFLTVGALGVSPSRAFASTIWIGNDTSGLVFHTTTTGVVLGSFAAPVTGIAFDGLNLFTGGSGGGIQRRTADGLTILNSLSTSVPGSPTEDLAWDSTRNSLWRIDHNAPVIQQINPTTGATISQFSMAGLGSTFASPGGLGIAYNPVADLLYASFCHAGCSSLNEGIVVSVNPTTGVFSTLFTTTGFATGGLGYDPLTGTLWVGDQTLVRQLTLGGTVLSSFTRPAGGGFVDGLEVIPDAAAVPEPSTLLLVGTGIAAALARKRRRSA